jgi:hypothetical protein
MLDLQLLLFQLSVQLSDRLGQGMIRVLQFLNDRLQLVDLSVLLNSQIGSNRELFLEKTNFPLSLFKHYAVSQHFIIRLFHFSFEVVNLFAVFDQNGRTERTEVVSIALFFLELFFQGGNFIIFHPDLSSKSHHFASQLLDLDVSSELGRVVLGLDQLTFVSQD